ncbi:uncharacterized protein LOC114876668 [Osmia bicornis bicornis]|uniref:uncharacterized protein LOC114876668 n=1 Tax=Osmia bicornis bicornis TaxID=1437191 RepID=UPI0010F74B40|nr:uncharacterized protein LOC114876668 [Osmia bicornis bicornis]
MSHSSFHNSKDNFVRERQILEPEASSEDHIVKRSQSGRQIKELNLNLRKCQSVDGSVKKLHKRRRRVRPRSLKVPQVPEKIVNIVNILQHENFLEVVDRFFKPKVAKQP